MNASTPRRRRAWSNALIIEEIQWRHQKGLALNPQALQQEDSALLAAGRRHFGSWSEAVKAAHVTPLGRRWTMIHRRGYWTCERILAHIHEYARSGQPLYAHAMQALDNCLVSAATYHFGSWAKALQAAGYDPEKLRGNRRWTRERVVNTILQFPLDDFPSPSMVRHDHYALFQASERLFGSWENAVHAVHAAQGSNLSLVSAQ